VSPETREYLESLLPLDEVHGITLAHGSPQEPVWEYLLSTDVAAVSFGQFSTPLCIVGHSHVPCIFVSHPEQGAVGAYADPGTQLALGGIRAIVNPGSVGQPRDRDPRAAYALYDSETASIEWRRVEYDIEVTQRHILDAGLPRYLADRLSRGA
jgi:diadenosine tetraphosphatase ApaH/serine/threonine PP2A family protein phosphatase